MTAAREPNDSPPATGKFLTVSNGLSLLRLLLTLPFVIVMTSDVANARLWGGGIIVLAALTDKFDGVLARRLGQTSEWGRLLDPLADKFAVGAVALTLFALGEIPLWFLVLTLARDVLILLGGAFVRLKTGVVLPALNVGKWTVGVMALALFVLVLGVHGIVTDVLIFLSALMAVISFLAYVVRASSALKGT